MAKIKVITDSTSYISKEYAREKDITVVPLNYTFDGGSYKEGYRGEFKDFFTKLKDSKLFPTTSQPSTGDFYEIFKESLKEYEELIVVLVSSKVSGTYNSALLAKSMLEGEKITIIDSKNAASNLRFLVEDAVNMIEDSISSEKIIDHIERKKEKLKVYLTTDTLEYLSRGGRLSSLQSMVGNLLNIKPVIELRNGELELLEKLRGRNRALSSIISYIDEEVEKISVCYTLNQKEAKKFKEKLEVKFPKARITIDDLGPVIGAHLGPGALGVCFY